MLTLDIKATSVIGPCFFKPSHVDDLVEYCRLAAASAPSKVSTIIIPPCQD